MKTILLITAMAISSKFCFGQTDSTAATSDSAPQKSTLTFGAVYSNNASYYGQRAVENTPYAAVAVNYRLKPGIYFAAQSYKLLNEKASGVSAASIGAGVNFALGKKFTIDLSYTHSFYPQYSPLLQAGNADNASLSFSHEGWINTSLTGEYAFGKTGDAFVTGGISKAIDLFSLGKKDIITISPSAELVGGTQRFYQTYVSKKKLRDSLFGTLPIPIFGNPSSGHIDTVATTAFNILSYNFKVPLAYNRAHYTVEAAYQLSILSKQVQADPGKVNSFLTFSFYYQL
jgi:hypothetical protein